MRTFARIRGVCCGLRYAGHAARACYANKLREQVVQCLGNRRMREHHIAQRAGRRVKIHRQLDDIDHLVRLDGIAPRMRPVLRSTIAFIRPSGRRITWAFGTAATGNRLTT